MSAAAWARLVEQSNMDACSQPVEFWADRLTAFPANNIDLARRQALERLRTLHPKLKPEAVAERLRRVPAGSNPSWLDLGFWSKEIDLVLLSGTQGGKMQQRAAIGRIRRVWPHIDAVVLSKRMEALAAEELPPYLRENFWTPEMDKMLSTGLRDGRPGQQAAINRILKMHPELRVALVRNRLQKLARRVLAEQTRRGTAYPWTPELDTHLVELSAAGGLYAGVMKVQRETSWPRHVICRRAHRLGIPSGQHREQRWSAIDRKYVVEHINHQAVENIASTLGRTVKSVRRKIEEMGLSGRNEEGYSAKRLAADLHVSPSTVRHWIGQGWLKRGRRGRIKEREFVVFLRNHWRELNLTKLEPHIQAFILECVQPKREGRAAEGTTAAAFGTTD